jgi:pyridoxal phosphate enzyme (YggS family)
MSGIAERLVQVQELIAGAARLSGRLPEAIRLVAVSKTHPVERVREAFAAGQLDFGENRVQELATKVPELPEARWHLIGPLQTNKIRQVLALRPALIQSVGSLRVLEGLIRHGAEWYSETYPLSILFQLNISEEVQKSGFEDLDDVRRALDWLLEHPEGQSIRVCGLMGMASFTDDSATVRSQFARLARYLADLELYRSPQAPLTELSMGMSGDYLHAIAEGATIVRVGSAIFGER